MQILNRQILIDGKMPVYAQCDPYICKKCYGCNAGGKPFFRSVAGMSYRFMRMMISLTSYRYDQGSAGVCPLSQISHKSGFVMMQESVYCKLILNQSAGARRRTATQTVRPRALCRCFASRKSRMLVWNTQGRRRATRLQRTKGLWNHDAGAPALQSPIELKENRVPVLIVENGQLFRQLIADLLAQENGEPESLLFRKLRCLIEIGKNVQMTLNPLFLN